MRLLSAFPGSSGHTPNVLTDPNYPKIREHALNLLKSGKLDDLISGGYSRLIVDEYQDCSMIQHQIVKCFRDWMPIVALGDPLQSIFTFNGAPPDWNDVVVNELGNMETLDFPWRWELAEKHDFGAWLLDVRNGLTSGDGVDLNRSPDEVDWWEVPGDPAAAERARLDAARAAVPFPDARTLVMGFSRFPAQQQNFAARVAGAVTVEAVDLKLVGQFAASFDLTSENALNQLLNFADSTLTGFDSNQFKEQVAHGIEINDVPDSEAGRRAIQFQDAATFTNAAAVLHSVSGLAGVHPHRPIVLQAMIRALRIAEHDSQGDLVEAALRVREQYRFTGRKLPKKAVGSTLLMKGLEAEVSVVLDADALSIQNLYVAMTRGSHSLRVCSRTPIVGATN